MGRSNCEYHFIIKELANKLEGQFECLKEKKENYKTFPVLIEKEIRKVDKDGNEDIITIFYKIKYIDSAKFMVSSLSNLLGNLAEKIHKIKGKECDCFLEYESVKDSLIKYKCLSYNKDYSNKIDEESTKRFGNMFKFSNNDINKFTLSLRKNAYHYEYIDEREKFDEISLPEKDYFLVI